MPYTTENNVRLRNGLYLEVNYRATEGILAYIQLEGRAYNIITLIKTTDAGVVSTLAPTTDYIFYAPDRINLVVSGESGDHFDVLYGTELSSTILTYFLEKATATIRGYLDSQYESSMSDWETLDGVATPTEPLGNTLAPDIIQGLCADLAGCNAEVSWMKKQMGFDPERMNALRQEKKRLIGMLDDIKGGKIKLPDIDLVETVDGRSSASFAFADLPILTRIDWATEVDRLNRRGSELVGGGSPLI